MGTEVCADGNTDDSDGCHMGVVQQGFVCTFLTDLHPDVCESTCGDGIRAMSNGNVVEECDDGNTRDNDGCSADCRLEHGYA